MSGAITVKEILDRVRAMGDATPPDVITDLGLLLERAAQASYDSSLYEKLGFPDEWLALRPTQAELDEVIDVLAGVLDGGHPGLAARAAWALGKARATRAVPRLLAALERHWRTSDDLAYQALIALEDHGLETAERVVGEIARSGLERSRELAVRLERKLARWREQDGGANEP